MVVGHYGVLQTLNNLFQKLTVSKIKILPSVTVLCGIIFALKYTSCCRTVESSPGPTPTVTMAGRIYFDNYLTVHVIF